MTNTAEAQDELSTAVGFLTSGIVEVAPNAIRDAIAKGADPNAVDEEGRTPLTEAILGGMGSQRAVKELLEGGADPNLKDKHGWTPWVACQYMQGNPVTEVEQKGILELLTRANADRSGEDVVKLDNCVEENNLECVRELIAAGVSVRPGFLCPLTTAARNKHVEMAALLLEAGANVDGDDEEGGLTPLMHAINDGNEELVRLLLDAGADVHYSLPGEELTALTYAEAFKNKAIIEMVFANSGSKPAPARQVPDKFKPVLDNDTNGINCGIDTDDILDKLMAWDKAYGIDISDVDFSRVVVTFKSLPDDMRALAEEIYEFCPDTIDQGYGCMDDMLETMEEMGQELDPEVAKLIEGVDFEDENFGLELLEKDVKNKKQVSLWWD